MITKGSEEKNYDIQYDWLYNSYYFKQNLDHVKKIYLDKLAREDPSLRHLTIIQKTSKKKIWEDK